MMVEFKFDDGDDPFDDGSDNPVPHTALERDYDRARDTLGQITLYATAHQATQFRTHIFSALVFRTYMRLLRWDRSGAIVTRKLYFCKPDDILVFFARLNSATPAERGVDPTVTVADLSHADRKEVMAALACKKDALLYEISVTETSRYIVSAHEKHYGSLSPTGRATRGFKAYCLVRKTCFFLKDCWRVLWDSLQAEHETYAILHEANVQNIPMCIEGADISDHKTITRRIAEKCGLELKLRNFQHYRLVLEYIGRTIEDFSDVREMVRAIRDASEGACQCFACLWFSGGSRSHWTLSTSTSCFICQDLTPGYQHRQYHDKGEGRSSRRRAC